MFTANLRIEAFLVISRLYKGHSLVDSSGRISWEQHLLSFHMFITTCLRPLYFLAILAGYKMLGPYFLEYFKDVTLLSSGIKCFGGKHWSKTDIFSFISNSVFLPHSGRSSPQDSPHLMGCEYKGLISSLHLQTTLKCHFIFRAPCGANRGLGILSQSNFSLKLIQ